MRRALLVSGAAALLALGMGCGDDGSPSGDIQGADTPTETDADSGPEVVEPTAQPGTKVRFDLDGAWDTADTFFDSPYPSDLRLGAHGGPDLTGYPLPEDLDLLTICDTADVSQLPDPTQLTARTRYP